MKIQILCSLVLVALSAPALADDAGKPHHACKQVADACRKAGFIKGDWKKGDGLWRDCVDPLMQGVTTVPGGTKPLPTVDAGLIAECKAHHPKFGGGKVGSEPAAKATGTPSQ